MAGDCSSQQNALVVPYELDRLIVPGSRLLTQASVRCVALALP